MGDVVADIPFPKEVADDLEKDGFKRASDIPPSRMSEALREELIRICTAGDEKQKGAFTISVAAHIERLISAAKDILIAERIAGNDINALMQTRRKRKHVNTIDLAYVGGEDDSTDPLMPGVQFAGGNENFGVQAIRQLVEMMRTAQDSPLKLVEALAAARDLGLSDVAAKIEEKLGVTSPKTDVPKNGTTVEQKETA